MDYRDFYLRVTPNEMKKIKKGIAYRLKTAGDPKTASWTVAPSVTVTRP